MAKPTAVAFVCHRAAVVQSAQRGYLIARNGTASSESAFFEEDFCLASFFGQSAIDEKDLLIVIRNALTAFGHANNMIGNGWHKQITSGVGFQQKYQGYRRMNRCKKKSVRVSQIAHRARRIEPVETCRDTSLGEIAAPQLGDSNSITSVIFKNDIRAHVFWDDSVGYTLGVVQQNIGFIICRFQQIWVE